MPRDHETHRAETRLPELPIDSRAVGARSVPKGGEPCPICDRPMVPGPSVDRHHWCPKSEGGSEATLMHRVCHRMIHRLFDHVTLADRLNTPEALRAEEEIQRFLTWVRRQPPEYVDWPAQPGRGGKRR